MGQHTWFYKDWNSYKKGKDLSQVIDEHHTGKIWLDSTELYQMESEHQSIREENSTYFHDCFRTFKREDNGSYYEGVIRSKEECDKWLEENAKYIYELDKERVDEFWNMFPNGVIDFG
jgi:hypothetical protein